MKYLAAVGLATALCLGSVGAAAAQGAPAAPAAAAKFSVESTIGDLLDNAAAKAVLVKHIPEVVANPMIDQGRGFPLSGIAQFVPELTPEMLAKIDADLKNL